MSGMLMEGISDGILRPPRIAYYMYKIPKARSPTTIQDLVNDIVFRYYSHSYDSYVMTHKL